MNKIKWNILLIAGMVLALQRTSFVTTVIAGEIENAEQRKLPDEIRNLKLSDGVKTVIGLNNRSGEYAARKKCIDELNDASIPPADLKALLLFLNFYHDDNRTMSLRDFCALKADVFDLIISQPNIEKGLGKRLSSMFYDARHDEAWRDDCIKYMRQYYEIRKRESKDARKDPELQSMQKVFWDALKTRDRIFAGTALTVLEQLSVDSVEIDRREVGRAAMALAADEQCLVENRITALRVCGQTGTADVMPEVRIIAQTGDPSTLRAAAVEAAGELGAESDIELLQSLVGGSDPGIKAAAASALNRIRIRKEQARALLSR